MAYDVYPYSYRNLRFVNLQPEEQPELPQEQRRGDLEGYLAAKDFASQTYSTCVSSNAQANIRQLNNLRPDLTSREYINILIKQGQVPEKHFKYRKDGNKEYISELNGNKETVKQVIFSSGGAETPVISRYYNPETGMVFKEVLYHKNGKTETKTFYDEVEALLEKMDNKPAVPEDEFVTNPLGQTNNPFEKLANT